MNHDDTGLRTKHDLKISSYNLLFWDDLTTIKKYHEDIMEK